MSIDSSMVSVQLLWSVANVCVIFKQRASMYLLGMVYVQHDNNLPENCCHGLLQLSLIIWQGNVEAGKGKGIGKGEGKSPDNADPDDGVATVQTMNDFVQGDHMSFDPADLEALQLDETKIDARFFKVLEAKLNVALWEIYMKEFAQHEPSVIVKMGAKSKSETLRVALPVMAGTRLPYIGRVVHAQNRAKGNYLQCCEILGVVCLHEQLATGFFTTLCNLQ